MHQERKALETCLPRWCPAKDLLSRLAIGMYLVVQVVALTSVYVVNIDNTVIITVFSIIIIITILVFTVVAIIMSKIQRKQRPTEISDDNAAIVPSIDVPLSQDVQFILDALRGPN